MKTKASTFSVTCSLVVVCSLGLVSLLMVGCGQRNRSTVESYETAAIEESKTDGDSSLRFANHPERNPFEESEKQGIATASNSKAIADSCVARSDSCVAHGKTAVNPFAKMAEANELPTINQEENRMFATSQKKNAQNSQKSNPFVVFDSEHRRKNELDYSSRTNGSDSFDKQIFPGDRRENLTDSSARTNIDSESTPTLNSFRTRWNNPTNEKTGSADYRNININGVNRGMIMDSHRIPRRIEEIPNPDGKRRRLFSPIPLKQSLEERLLLQKMKQKHGELYAELKKANFSDSQIQAIAIETMRDKETDNIENARFEAGESKKKTDRSSS